MALKIRDAGTLRTITKLTIRQAGVNRNIRTLQVMDDGVLRTVAIFTSPLSVTAGSVSGSYNSGGSATIATGTATASVAGGLGPYTYAWVRLTNGGGNASTATAASNASTAFVKTNVPEGVAYSDTWEVTVTDSFGATASDQISATFRNIGIN